MGKSIKASFMRTRNDLFTREKGYWKDVNSSLDASSHLYKTRSPEIRDFHCRSQFFTQKKKHSDTSIDVSNICGSARSLRICMEIS